MSQFSKLVGVAIALFLCSACANDIGSARSTDDIEALLYEQSSSALLFEEADLVTECARVNGFSDYLQTIERYQPRSIVVGDGEEGLEFAQSYGTGSLELFRLRLEMLEANDVPDTESADDPKLQEILQKGPIVTTDGVEFPGGCYQWANEKVAAGEPARLRASLETAYADHMQGEYFESAEYERLQDEWVSCVRGEGFPDVRVRDDLFAVVEDAEEAWHQGSMPYEEALEIDITVGVVAWTCQQKIAPELEVLSSDAVGSFADERDSQLDELDELSK